jgi:excisionase family DNA binding protein
MMEQNDQKKYLTQAEAADYVRLSPLTLWRLRKSGELPYCRSASKVLYLRSELDSYLCRDRAPRTVKAKS